MSFLELEMNPCWACFSLAIVNTIAYVLIGFEAAIFTTLLALLWYEMVIKSKDAQCTKSEVKK